jgi:predicted nucleotidyltransferase
MDSTPADILDEIVERINESIEPQQIVLYGSRARGDATTDSDYDILVIAPSNEPRWRRTVKLYQALAGMGIPKDIVWWTPEEVNEWRGVRTHFITVALREGRTLYEALA